LQGLALIKTCLEWALKESKCRRYRAAKQVGAPKGNLPDGLVDQSHEHGIFLTGQGRLRIGTAGGLPVSLCRTITLLKFLVSMPTEHLVERNQP
jgi:hypothetical protein